MTTSKVSHVHSNPPPDVPVVEQFAARCLRPGETVDIYLAELRKLATQFGGTTERGLICAFIAGLPEHAENLLPSLSIAVPSLSLSPSFSFLPSFSLSFQFSPSFLPSLSCNTFVGQMHSEQIRSFSRYRAYLYYREIS